MQRRQEKEGRGSRSADSEPNESFATRKACREQRESGIGHRGDTRTSLRPSEETECPPPSVLSPGILTRRLSRLPLSVSGCNRTSHVTRWVAAGAKGCQKLKQLSV